MFILSLLPTQEVNNLAVGLGQRLRAICFSRSLLFSRPPSVCTGWPHIMFSLYRSGFAIKTFISARLFYHPSLWPSCPEPAAAPWGLAAPPGGSQNRLRCSSGAGQTLRPRALRSKTWASHWPLRCLTAQKSRPRAAAVPQASRLWPGLVLTRKTPKKHERSLSTYCVVSYL